MGNYSTDNNVVTTEKTIPNPSDTGKELIKDYMLLTGVFERNLKCNQVIDAIFDNLEPNTNVYLGTYKQISSSLNMSYSTVVRTFQYLIANKIIEPISKGAYRVNTVFIQPQIDSLQIKYVPKGEPQ